MNIRVFVILCLVLSVNPIIAQRVLLLEGFYQGKNLFVQNTIPESGIGYSVYQVKLNGSLTTDELNSFAVEIDLGNSKLSLGDSVFVEIYYKVGQAPKILTPEVLLPLSTFEIVTQNINDKGFFTWSAKNENGSLDYIVEQYRWKKWVKIGEVEGIGTPEVHHYSFQITPNFGKNIVRVRQYDFNKQNRTSSPVEFISEVKEVKAMRLSGGSQFIFSTETLYQVYDYHDDLIITGFGSSLDISRLKKGAYYLNYDNRTISFGISGSDEQNENFKGPYSSR